MLDSVSLGSDLLDLKVRLMSAFKIIGIKIS